MTGPNPRTPVAASTCYDRRASACDPERASLRAKSDAALSLKIDGARADNRKLSGARKIWHLLRRDGEDIARCTVEWLMLEARIDLSVGTVGDACSATDGMTGL